MKQDRRGFLKLFGVSTAAIVAAPIAADAEPTVEVMKTETPATPQSELIERTWRNPRLHEGPYGYNLDVRDEPLWSALRIEPNSMVGSYKLFQQTGADGLTLGETNMLQAGKLPAPEMYCIKQIGFVFSPKTIPGLRSAFIDRYALSLYLGRKRYWESPLSTVFSVAEPERDAKGFATLPDAGFATLEIPLVIEHELYFSLELIGKPIHPCGKILGWGVFRGLHAVGIQ
jgi:hypothetical protein